MKEFSVHKGVLDYASGNTFGALLVLKSYVEVQPLDEVESFRAGMLTSHLM